MSPHANTVNINPAPRGYHHGDLRDALIEAGMALLERPHSPEPGLREVAREVGVSATAVYRHFPDKDALLRAMAARGFAMMGAMQTQAAAGLTGEPAFCAVGRAYVRFALKHAAIFRLMFRRAPPHDLFNLPEDATTEPFRLLRDNVAGLIPPGASAAARKIVAIRAWALVHGLALLTLDHMVQADDALIDAVIASARVD